MQKEKPWVTVKMFNGRSTEFFEGDNTRLSSTRLGLMIGILIMAFVVLAITFATVLVMARDDFNGVNPDGGLLFGICGIFASLCAGVYGMARLSADSVTKASMNPAPVAPAIIPVVPAGPNTIIQVGQQNPPVPDAKVKDVNMSVEGDVNVDSKSKHGSE